MLSLSKGMNEYNQAYLEKFVITRNSEYMGAAMSYYVHLRLSRFIFTIPYIVSMLVYRRRPLFAAFMVLVRLGGRHAVVTILNYV